MKELEAKRIIEKYLQRCFNPIVTCSFGKDSVVMLHLVRSVYNKIPVLFLKEPFNPKKYQFANKLIEDWDLNVYDFAPSSTDTLIEDNTFEIFNIYEANGGKLVLPTSIEDPKEGELYLCGRDDFLLKAKCVGYQFKWDCVFIGHKSTDVNPFLHETQITSEAALLGNIHAVFPIKDWTDKDIWEYTEKYNVPYNDKRYNKDNGYKEFEDRTYNNDYYTACSKCIDYRNPSVVMCPKIGKYIVNGGKSKDKNDSDLSVLKSAFTYLKQGR